MVDVRADGRARVGSAAREGPPHKTAQRYHRGLDVTDGFRIVGGNPDPAGPSGDILTFGPAVINLRS